MKPYTPPEPDGFYEQEYMGEPSRIEPRFTEAQLRAEVERVRRETVKECAEAIDDACREQIMTASDCIELIRELLK